MLERFGVEPPRYIKSFEPRLSDVQYREVPGISEELSLHRAWDYICRTKMIFRRWPLLMRIAA